jgi:hypothetical protein
MTRTISFQFHVKSFVYGVALTVAIGGTAVAWWLR